MLIASRPPNYPFEPQRGAMFWLKRWDHVPVTAHRGFRPLRPAGAGESIWSDVAINIEPLPGLGLNAGRGGTPGEKRAAATVTILRIRRRTG